MVPFIVGFWVGLIVMVFIVWQVMLRMMIVTVKSKLPVEDAIRRIEEEAPRYGWGVAHIYDMDETLAEKGYKGLKRVRIVSLCKPEYAYRILSRQEDRKIAAAMPCRIAIYEDDNGESYISKFNIKLMGRMFGGIVGDVMGEVAKEEEAILRKVL